MDKGQEMGETGVVLCVEGTAGPCRTAGTGPGGTPERGMRVGAGERDEARQAGQGLLANPEGALHPNVG